MSNIKVAIDNVLTRSLTIEKHINLISNKLNVYPTDSVEDAINKLMQAISDADVLTEHQKKDYKTSCRKTLAEYGAPDTRKNSNVKKYYVAIYDKKGNIIRVRRLFSEDKVKEVIEENEAFGYKAKRGWLGTPKDSSIQGLSWRVKGNHSNRNNDKIQYVPYRLIV